MSSDDHIARLLRVDEDLSRLEWPCPTSIERLPLGPRSCLVVAAGFEKRATAALLSARNVSDNFHVCLVRYRPPVKENRERELLQLCKEMHASVETVEYDREETHWYWRYRCRLH